MVRKDKKKKQGKNRFLYEKYLSTALMLVAAYAALMLLCMATMSPERYDLKVGDVAKKTITASKDVVDEVNTQRRRDAAAANVAPVYYKDESTSEIVLQDLISAFDELHLAQQFGEEIRAARTPESSSVYTDEEYQKAAAILTRVKLSNYQMTTLLNTNAQEIDNLYQSIEAATRTTLIGTIPEGQESDALNSIQQLVAYNTSSNLWWNVANPTLRACLQANMKIDQEATEENRQKMMDEVEPSVYKQGQNIVIKGDRVTEPQLAVLTSLGLLAGDRFDAELYIGTGIVIIFILMMFVCLSMLFCREQMAIRQNQVIVLLVCLLSLLLCVAIAQVNTSMMPITLVALLLTVTISGRVAFIANAALSLVFALFTIKGNGLVPTQVLSVLLITMCGGTIAIFSLRKSSSRGAVLLTGLYVGAVNMICVLCVGLLTSNDITSNMRDAWYTCIGAVVAAILCVGMLPALEAVFNLATPSKLMELANPNHPLLRRLMIEAPGTYHHSVIVGNIAEAAAEIIGANPLLVRVGAYYHDIGKLKRPIYFKENQMGENPHDFTDPRVSTAILTEHTRDGVLMAQKYHLPPIIIDMIRQHHGDTPVMFFYHKAVQLYGEENVDVADFRYDGPRPQTMEAALLMLADTVEAAVRSIPEPTPEKIVATIRKLVRGKIDDEQLNDSPLTFRDVNAICDGFATVLNGVFHERIEYPSIEIKKKDDLPVAQLSGYIPSKQDEALLEKQREKQDAKTASEEREKVLEKAHQQEEEVQKEIDAHMLPGSDAVKDAPKDAATDTAADAPQDEHKKEGTGDSK